MLQFTPSLIDKNISIIKKKEWYNQRFDACINLIWMILEGEMRSEERKMKGGNFTSHVGIFGENKTDWYIDMTDIKRVSKIFLEFAKKERGTSKQLMRLWKRDEKKFINICKRIGTMSLPQLKMSDLRMWYVRLSDIYRNAISSSSLIDGFALGTDEIVQTEIDRLLDTRKVEKERGIIFSSLTAPIHQSFINQAELSLLRIADSIAHNGKAHQIFMGKIACIKMMLVDFKRINSKIETHTARYFWIKNNYYNNHILTKDYFINQIKSLLKARVNIRKEYERIINTPLRNRRMKRKLYQQLHPGHYLKKLLEISEDFTHWQDERKKMTFYYTHYASLVLRVIGRTLGYCLDEMKCLTSAEVLQLINGKLYISKQELARRIKFSLVYQKGNRYEILTGNEAKAMIKKFFPQSEKRTISDFRGLPASGGKTRGRVAIVKSVKEVHKVRQGDILVAVMTRPDYIMGIKKAAAIVTDEGGITCHAAIVSRELGIPCIIGTKIATQVLKDGDLVEVNANHGWVRKISV